MIEAIQTPFVANHIQLSWVKPVNKINRIRWLKPRMLALNFQHNIFQNMTSVTKWHVGTLIVSFQSKDLASEFKIKMSPILSSYQQMTMSVTDKTLSLILHKLCHITYLWIFFAFIETATV